MDKEQILAEYKKVCDAMIHADTVYLERVFGKTVRHVSGYEQSTSDWLHDIKGGNMKYYSITLKDVSVDIDGDRARLYCKSILDAFVYGVRGRWSLPTEAEFQCTNGEWHITQGSNKIR